MGELLTNHHGVEVEAVESMEMAPGVNPRPGRVPEQELLTPKTCLDDGRGDGTFRKRRLWLFWVFTSKAIYRRKGEVGGRQVAPHHP